MKQGPSKEISRGKGTFHVNRASPGAVSEIGIQQTHLRGQPQTRLLKPIGTSAPKANVTSHRSGTQGKH